MFRRFLFFVALAFLAAVPVVLIQRDNSLQKVFQQLFPTPTPRVREIKGIGVIGDSQSDEYQADDARGYQYAPTTLNWIEQLVKSRDLNFGIWSTWGDIRRTGFAYNWSRTGASTESLLPNGQYLGLAEQVRQGEVDIVIVNIGVNDFGPYTHNGYFQIYEGTLSSDEIDEKIDRVTQNITAAIDTIQKAGKASLVLVLIPDWNISAPMQLAPIDQQGKERVSLVIRRTNEKLISMARKRRVAVIDSNDFYRSLLSKAPVGSIRIGEADISLLIPGDDPHQAFLSDGIHAGTIVQGLFANYIIAHMNKELGTNITPLSDREILSNAGL